jgi:mannose-1-phosphate guanylyltransferase/phosphomannomutase
MAGGEGTRLRPLTSNLPKPMLTVVNRPMMEHVINLLKVHGIEDIVVTVAFQGNAIRAYFGNGAEFGVRISYATEEETALGTAGSIRNAMAEVDGTFLVISGDVLTDMDLGAMIRFHQERSAMATVGLKAIDNPLEFAIVLTGADGRIERFLEKPTWGEVFSDTVNTGIYVLEPEIFDFIDPEVPVDFSEDVFPRLLEACRPVYGFVADGYWEDVGTFESYAKAHQDVLDGRVGVTMPGFGMADGVWLGIGVEIKPTSTIEGPAIIGDYCTIGPGVHVLPYSVLGSNVTLGADALVERSVIHDNVHVGADVHLRGTVVARGCDLRQGARCEEGVVLGEECFVGQHAVVNPGVKVYPFKSVDPGATVTTSIVWESRGSRQLFGRLGVSGLANVDVSPELAMRMAMAFASTMRKGDTVVSSRDTSRAARVLKRAVMVGLNSAGVDVSDLEVATVPVTRQQVRVQRAAGGISVRLVADDPQSVVIRFFDERGIDINEATQRKVERIYHREDFRRALAGEIGDIALPSRTLEYYTSYLGELVDVEVIRKRRFKVVLDYAYGAASFVMPDVLAKLGADVLAVNPYGSTRQALGFDLATHSADVAAMVRASGADLGALIDGDGEHLHLIDDRGWTLSHEEGLLSFLSLVLVSTPSPRVALPVTVSRAAEEMCRQAGADLVWSKVATPQLMEAATTAGVVFAAGQDGGYIFPSFLPAYDAVFALVKILELLAGARTTLSAVVARTPEVHFAREGVATPWDLKGLVMRRVLERSAEQQVLMVDGIKVVHDDGWALVLPDPEHPLTHVVAEAASPVAAKARADSYASLIREVLLKQV